MKWILLIVFLCCFSAIKLQAQTQNDSAYKVADTANKSFTSVQIQAKFPGGQAGWTNYLQHNLRADVGAENVKVKRHQTVRQTVIVVFLVDKVGKISEVSCANPTEVHPKLAEEAMRVIKQGPDWLPATINGEPVFYRQKQAITFVVSAE